MVHEGNDAALAVLLVLLTAVANASAVVLQRRAAQDTAVRLGGPGSVREVARHPAWRLGIAVFAVAVALQVGALALGSITLVQPVLVMNLPFTLLVGWLVLGGALRVREWSAVGSLAVGLVVLLVSLRPGGGDALDADSTNWVVGATVTLGLLVVLMTLGARSRGAGRAVLYGMAAGAGGGFVAVIAKTMTEALGRGGFGEVLVTWQSYLLVPAAPLAFLALQYALGAGRLLASQPGLVLGNPVLASCWGVGLLGERVRGGVALLGGSAGAVLMIIGVFLLAGSPLLAAQEAGPRTPAGSST